MYVCLPHICVSLSLARGLHQGGRHLRCHRESRSFGCCCLPPCGAGALPFAHKHCVAHASTQPLPPLPTLTTSPLQFSLVVWPPAWRYRVSIVFLSCFDFVCLPHANPKLATVPTRRPTDVSPLHRLIYSPTRKAAKIVRVHTRSFATQHPAAAGADSGAFKPPPLSTPAALHAQRALLHVRAPPLPAAT